MERRKALKNLTGLAALAFLPKQHLFALQQMKPLHIVGLGSAGAKVLQLIKSKGYGDIYTAINDGEDLNDGTRFIHYRDYMTKRDRLLQEYDHPEATLPFSFPDEVRQVFQRDQKFVLLGGLGGHTATQMSKAIIPYLKQENISFKAVFTNPFIFEGKRKMAFAGEVVDMSKGNPHIRFVDTESMRPHLGKLTIRAAFKKVDERMVETFVEMQVARI
jgi:cell division GTPase FtsZ